MRLYIHFTDSLNSQVYWAPIQLLVMLTSLHFIWQYNFTCSGGSIFAGGGKKNLNVNGEVSDEDILLY